MESVIYFDEDGNIYICDDPKSMNIEKYEDAGEINITMAWVHPMKPLARTMPVMPDLGLSIEEVKGRIQQLKDEIGVPE